MTIHLVVEIIMIAVLAFVGAVAFSFLYIAAVDLGIWILDYLIWWN